MVIIEILYPLDKQVVYISESCLIYLSNACKSVPEPYHTQ